MNFFANISQIRIFLKNMLSFEVYKQIQQDYQEKINQMKKDLLEEINKIKSAKFSTIGCGCNSAINSQKKQ